VSNYERLATAAEVSAAPEPLYLQVYSAITDAIRSGRLKPGDRLAPEQLCEQFGVSRATVRRAFRQLIDDAVVETTVGRGSFVSGAPLTEPPNVLMSFTELASVRGLTASAHVLSKHVRPASPEEASVFGIALHELVFDLERLRLLDEVPTALDRTRVPTSIAPELADLDFTHASVYAALEKAGAAPVKADVVVSATPADNLAADTLGVAINAPLIVCTTMSYDSRGRLVEIGEIKYRADRYQFRAVLRRRSPSQATRDQHAE
jgi:GntR family transcriptional regulator